MLKISQSRLGAWKRCNYLHYLKYVERIIPKSAKNRPLYFGSDMHLLLENHTSNTDLSGIKKVFEEITERYNQLSAQELNDLGGDYLNELKTIFMDYKYCYLPFNTDKREVEFNLELRKDVIFNGKIDAIIEEENELTIVEHKTFNNKPSSIVFDMNAQSLLYAKALRLMGYANKPIKVLWNYIHSKPAQEPVIVDGKIKATKNNKVIPQSFMRTAKTIGMPFGEARNQSLEYSCNIENFYFRKETTLFDTAVDNFWSGTMNDIKMIYKYGEKCKSKNITKDCGWCDYQPICVLELNGGDVESLKKSQYKLKEEVK